MILRPRTSCLRDSESTARKDFKKCILECLHILIDEDLAGFKVGILGNADEG